VSRVLNSVALFAALAVASSLSCRPDLGDRESLVTGTQILAIQGEPPEVKPGVVARYSLLVATPDGPSVTPAASWAFCSTPKLLTENGAASAACLGDGARPVADGLAAIEAAMPEDACAIFGPEVTSAELRPRDPDVTGGYYQPLRVTLGAPEGNVTAFGLERISCALTNASADVTTDFAARYTPNENPVLDRLTATVAGAPAALDAIPRGAKVTLRVSWPEASAERYVVYDLASRSLVSHRESMRVSWFTTAGVFESDRTGRTEDELDAFTENEWTAPVEPRTVHLYVVLRDARGGVAFATHTIVTR